MGQSAKDKNDTSRVPRTGRPASNSRTKKTSKADDEHLARLPLYMGEVTWRVAVPILTMSLGGNWLDNRFDTRPLFSIIGVLLSILFASLLVYKFLLRTFPDIMGGKK